MRARFRNATAIWVCTAVIEFTSSANAGFSVEHHAWQPCILASQPGDDAVTHPDCVVRNENGNLRIDPTQLRKLRFDSNGLAVINSEGRFYYVRRDGRIAPTMVYDSLADPFVNGRARSPLNGKIGYIDQQLTMIIPATYDGAYVFDHGHAVVCMGCTLKSDGEYHWYEGGKWGCIDQFGRELSPFRPLKHGEPTPPAVCRKSR